jgi:hypothetical protein
MIYSYNNVILNKDGQPVFRFDEDQTAAMGNLIQSLRDNCSTQEVAKHVVITLDSFYFPSDIDRSVYDTRRTTSRLFRFKESHGISLTSSSS